MLGDGGQLQDEDHLDQLKKPKKLMKIPGSLIGLAVDDRKSAFTVDAGITLQQVRIGKLHSDQRISIINFSVNG